MNDNYKVVIIGLFAFLCISLYGKYRCDHPEYQDILMKKLGVLDLDGWSINHFLFFGTLGYLFPDTLITAMAMGVVWELFENTVGKARPAVMGGFGDCVTTDPAVTGPWWFGRMSDIVVNFIGFLCGMWLNKYMGGHSLF